MTVDSAAETPALRSTLRDLVALSSMPMAWASREPAAVVSALADALAGLLQLDYVYVRLCVPDAAGAVDVTRGDAWREFPAWLEDHLAETRWLSGAQIIPDVGGAGLYRGVVIPIGVNADYGVVAAACDRIDFPADTDQLMLRVAANSAATAFQCARLLQERTKAGEQLRKARSELELKVAERAAELRTSEAYLSDAQRLTQTGSYALNVGTWELSHSSDQHRRLFGFEPRGPIPPLEEFVERMHPDDRPARAEAMERAVREAAGFETEYRIVAPGSPVRHVRSIAHPVFDVFGALEGFMGTVVDVTERKHAEEEQRAQLWFLESLDRIDRAIQGTSDLEQMMGDVLDVTVEIFGCDRAWLVYPCDPEAGYLRLLVESTAPDSAHGLEPGAAVPNDPELASVSRIALASSGPVCFGPESDDAVPQGLAERFGVKSMITFPVWPKVDRPYLFGLHQCSYPRVWTPREQRLFHDIGRRLADALDTLLMFRNLRESELKLEASRAELAASRSRIVAAADEMRRKIERDLHDGVQQRLISLALAQRMAMAALPDGQGDIDAQLLEVADGLAAVLEELQEISRGIHPAILAQGGLVPALRTLARRSMVPVELEVRAAGRHPEPVEVAAYYVVSEALTNTAKHADASHVRVCVESRDGVLVLSIRDDGRGGADPAHGSGLIGLTDRVHSLGGTIDVDSPPGRGTTLRITLPL